MPRRAAPEQARWSCFINKTGLSENQRRRRPKVLVSKESALVTGVHATRSACVSHLNNRVSLLLVLRFLGSRRAAGLKRAFVSKRRSDRNSGLLKFGLFVGRRGGGRGGAEQRPLPLFEAAFIARGGRAKASLCISDGTVVRALISPRWYVSFL